MNQATETSVGRKHNGNGMDHQATPEEIERALAHTRAELDDTLRAIERRLSPGDLVDQALDYLKGGPKEFAENLGAQARDNPLPVALMAISTGWLMMGSRQEPRYAYPDYTSEGIPESGPGIAERGKSVVGSATESLRHTKEAMSEKSAEVRARVGRRMSSAREGMESSSAGMGERARGIAAGMRSRGADVSAGIRGSSDKARDTFSHLLHEQPLVLGLMGIAVGAVIAAGLPTTRREREALAPARETMGRVAESGREEWEKTREELKQAAAETPPSPSPT